MTYTTSIEVRPLTIFECIFIFFLVIAAVSALVMGCYFTYMTRYGRLRVFEERVSARKEHSQTDGRNEGKGSESLSSSSPSSLEDTGESQAITSKTKLISSDELHSEDVLTRTNTTRVESKSTTT
ncbi:hypothetical protein GCK32_015273 [Trichostrongylus colubriformis]|uniref:Uncharacterized protein n=1 Tax=Trichostrongylus colubriformis TaxID=6319 RepID=A0AAN8J397_TRICO